MTVLNVWFDTQEHQQASLKPLWAGLCPHTGEGGRTDSCCRCSAGLAASRGGGCARLCASRPSAKTLFFFQTPAYLFQKEPRSARGLPAMSSLVGVVRKQLKSHPAVSDRPARFRPMRSGDIESAAEDARPQLISLKPSDVTSDTVFFNIFRFLLCSAAQVGGFTA